MSDPELVAIATGAAANLTADMIRDQWLQARALLVRMLHHGTEAEQAEAIPLADSQQQALAGGSASNEETACLAWQEFFTEFGERHRAAVPALRALAESSDARVQFQHNEASGAFIGGNVYGGLTINQGSSDGTAR